MTDLKTHPRATFAIAQKHLDKSAEGRKVYYDQKASHNELLVGNKVWYYIFAQPVGRTHATTQKPASFCPIGLAHIWSHISPVVYRIKISCGKKEPTYKWVHHNQNKPHRTPVDSDEDPITQLGDN